MPNQFNVPGQCFFRDEFGQIIDLASGRLVRPFDYNLPAEFAYYIVCPEATADQPKVVAFRQWLLQESARSSGG